MSHLNAEEMTGIDNAAPRGMWLTIKRLGNTERNRPTHGADTKFFPSFHTIHTSFSSFHRQDKISVPTFFILIFSSFSSGPAPLPLI